MKTLVCLTVLLACSVVGAQPPGRSQHPRVGLLAELEFHEGSARLPEASGSQLGQVAAWASDNFDGLIVVDGHADARGPAAGSVRLSMRRARLVRDQLIAIGVDPGQIIISAFGSEGRRQARVAVWGTRTSLESVIANRRRARRIEMSDERKLDMKPRQARPPRDPRR